MKILKYNFIIVFILLIKSLAFNQKIFYVSIDGSSSNNGLSWQFALSNPNEALSLAKSGDQVWVAKGNYIPTKTNDRNISFKIPPGVQLLGGFDGTETLLSQRNHTTNKTILSGNIGVEKDSADNSYNVVQIINSNEKAVLDGFVIRDGYARGLNPNPNYKIRENYGAGVFIYNETGSDSCVTEIKNCTFSHLDATYDGTAIFASAEEKNGIVISISENNFLFETFGQNFPINEHKFFYFQSIKSKSTLQFTKNKLKFKKNFLGKYVMGVNLLNSDSSFIKFSENDIDCSFLNNMSFLHPTNVKNQTFIFEDNNLVSLKSFWIEGIKCSFIFLRNTFRGPTGLISVASNNNNTYSFVENLTFSNNFLENSGVYLSANNQNFLFEKNTICNSNVSSVIYKKGFYAGNVIVNSDFIIYNNLDSALFFFNNSIKKNTIFKLTSTYNNNPKKSMILFNNNLFDSNDCFRIEDNYKLSLSHNLFNNQAQYDWFNTANVISNEKSIVASPIYMNTDSCSAKLSPCSRGVDEGMLINDIENRDILNQSRIVNKIDIGAYENQLPLPIFIKNSDTAVCKGSSIEIKLNTPYDVVWSDGIQGKERTLESGNYSYLIKDNNNCLFQDTFNISPVRKSFKNVPLCKNETYFFSGKQYKAGDVISYISSSPFDCDTAIDINLIPVDNLINIKDTFTSDNKDLLYNDKIYNLGDTISYFKPNLPKCDSLIYLVYKETITKGKLNLIFPNIIMPHSSQNNVWKIEFPPPYIILVCVIKDRWGNIVYKSESEINWDGKFNGNSVESGVYHYFIRLMLPTGEILNKNGDLTVLK